MDHRPNKSALTTDTNLSFFFLLTRGQDFHRGRENISAQWNMSRCGSFSIHDFFIENNLYVIPLLIFIISLLLIYKNTQNSPLLTCCRWNTGIPTEIYTWVEKKKQWCIYQATKLRTNNWNCFRWDNSKAGSGVCTAEFSNKAMIKTFLCFWVRMNIQFSAVFILKQSINNPVQKMLIIFLKICHYVLQWGVHC